MAKLNKIYPVLIIESERGWGSSHEVENYDNEQEALARIESVNAADRVMNKEARAKGHVPDFYIIARRGW